MSEPFSVGGGYTGFTPGLIGGTGTTTKVFASLLGPGFNNGGGNLQNGFATAPVTIPTAASGTLPGTVTVPGTGQYEQEQLVFTATGFLFVHGTSPTVNFVIQSGTSLTAASNTTVATLTSAQSLTTGAYYPWALSLKGSCDALSGIFQFFSATFVCNGVSGATTLTSLTSQNLTTTNVNFVLGITFGVTDALNVGGISQWWGTVA
jgi:hypothetical protein